MKSFGSLALAILCLIAPILTWNAPGRADSIPDTNKTGPRNDYMMWDYYEGNKYTSELTPEQVQKAPHWSHNDDNPPLSARKALAAATEMLAKLLPDASQWTLHSISLEPVFGHTGWVYVITFDSYFHHPPGVPFVGSGYLPPMHFYVLLSGTVVEPIVTQGKPGQSNNALHRTPPAAVSPASAVAFLGRLRR